MNINCLERLQWLSLLCVNKPTSSFSWVHGPSSLTRKHGLAEFQSMEHGRIESDTTEATWHACMHWRRKWNPLQQSCLENPRDRGAWWAAIYGVAQSQTRLMRLSSSSSSSSAQSLSCVRVSVTPRTAALQSPLSMGICQARILEWVAYPFSRGSSPPRNQIRSPALQANSLPAELRGKPI